MKRPYKVKAGMAVGLLAVLVSLAMFSLYLPGSAAALVWPYEWAMIIAWSGLGLLLYLMSGVKGSR